MKTTVLRSLARLRLLRPTYRGYERVRALGHTDTGASEETLPVPPAKLRIRVAGTAAVDWCRENLPFATFTQNGLDPPLPFPDEVVDLVYAFSVLTHLPVPVQHAWTEELTRILRPGGYLVVSTHGEAYLERLGPDEREAFQRGEVV